MSKFQIAVEWIAGQHHDVNTITMCEFTRSVSNMALEKFQIAVEWLESKDQEMINLANIRHVLVNLSSTGEGTEWQLLTQESCLDVQS